MQNYMESLSYLSIVDGMDESATGSAPSLLLLPAHNNQNSEGDDDDAQLDGASNAAKNNRARSLKSKQKAPNKNYASNLSNNTAATGSSYSTLDIPESTNCLANNNNNNNVNNNNNNNNNSSTNNNKQPLDKTISNFSAASGQALQGVPSLQSSYNENAQMDMPTTAPIAKFITIKTYRPAKVGAGLIVLIALLLLFIAAVTSEWLGRLDMPDAPKGSTFYRYGLFEFCHGYILRKTSETTATCEFGPILTKTWVQICAGLYGGGILFVFAGFILLCSAIKMDTNNSCKWRLYKAAIACFLVAAAILVSCLLFWAVRFMFEASVLHRQRLYRNDPSPDSPDFAYSLLFSQQRPGGSSKFTTKYRRTTPPRTSTPSAISFYYPPYGQTQPRNNTISEQIIQELHSVVWPQVMSTIVVGWGYMLAWFAVVLIILPAVLLIFDGKKDEHVCEEQLVYPASSA